MATHKSTLSSALLFLAFGLGRAAGTLIPEPTVVSNATPPITVFGDNGSLNGIFDPSAMIFGNSVYMTYSAVPAANAIRTRLAVLAGAANASQWTFLTELNAPFSASLPGTSCPGGVCVGTVVHEVSSLVVEDEDPDPLRRVKVRRFAWDLTESSSIRDVQCRSSHTLTSWGPLGSSTTT